MLDLAGVIAGYGPVTILHGVNLSARAGEVTCIMGRNGAGKTTLMKTIMGLLPLTSGSIHLSGVAIHGLPAHQVPRHGLAWVPQGRRLFGPMTVAENLEVGGLARGNRAEILEHVLNLFPRLRERLDQPANTLSGGEQQMLAIARALCLEPRVLLLDEPTEGLQPSMITLIRDAISRLSSEGVAVVLVEQKVEAVLQMATRVAFMAHGRVEEVVERSALMPGARQFQDYVGV